MNILAEAGGGYGHGFGMGQSDRIFWYYGGRLELLVLKRFLLGIGAGMDGYNSSTFQYIRGSLAFVLFDTPSASDFYWSMRAYYDYGFEDQYRLGMLINVSWIFKD